MPIGKPKLKERPDTDPKKDTETGPDVPVKEPPETKEKPVKEPGKPDPKKKAGKKGDKNY